MRTVRHGSAHTRSTQGRRASTIRHTQRTPLAFTQGAGDERPGSRYPPLGRAPLAPPPLNRRIDAHDHRALRYEDVQAQLQPPAARVERRPLGPVEHPVVVLAVRVGAFPMTRTTAATVRLPGASIAPTSNSVPDANPRVENNGAKRPITVITAMGRSGIGPLSDLRRAYPMNVPSLSRQYNPSVSMDKVELREGPNPVFQQPARSRRIPCTHRQPGIASVLVPIRWARWRCVRWCWLGPRKLPAAPLRCLIVARC